jgi:hypothetical protein
MTPAERTAMGEIALDSFQRRYDMRENAKAIIRLFEAATAPDEEHTPVGS